MTATQPNKSRRDVLRLGCGIAAADLELGDD